MSTISLSSCSRESGAPAKNESFFHICYKTDDIQSFGRELQSKGVPLYEGPAFLGKKVAGDFVPTRAKCNSLTFFTVDPDGNDIEVMEYTPESMQLAY